MNCLFHICILSNPEANPTVCSTRKVVLWFGVPLLCWLVVAMCDSLTRHLHKLNAALKDPILPLAHDSNHHSLIGAMAMGKIAFGGINTQPQQV
jgi:hypothetical protein